MRDFISTSKEHVDSNRVIPFPSLLIQPSSANHFDEVPRSPHPRRPRRR